MGYDFKDLNAVLLARAGEFLLEWLPGGRMIGREYTCGDLHGGPGDSLKFNILKGFGSDFATGEKFSDMIDLYAKIENISMGEAYKKLAEKVGFGVTPEPAPKKPIEHVITAPPTTCGIPKFKHHKYGEPVAFWAYKDSEGKPFFYVARYETATGKEFLPWSWSETTKKWVCKGQPAPRPLYGLDKLAARPNAPVMICEGEGCADAAEIITEGKYVCVSWTNGSKGTSKTNWKTLWGRKILIWPDNDDPGMDAGFQIAKLLDNHCPEVKIIKPYDKPPKWDAADALAEGWNWAKLLEWAKPRAEIYQKEQPLAVKPVPFNEPVEQPQPEQKVEPEQAQPEIVQASAVAKTEQNVAIANVNVTVNPEDTGSSNQHALWNSIGLITNGNGTPHMNIDNALRIIEAYEPLKGMVWFDDFHQKLFTTNGNNGKTREWSNVDTLKLTSYMQRNLGMPKISDEMIYKACTIFGHRNMRNEPRDWMNSLVWDGTERISNFFCDALGVPEREYSFAASRNFWIGMVARILRPGCKMDNMVVFEGPQGTFKSSAIELIGGNWYTSARGSVLEKDFFLTLHGKMIVEIAELSSFRKAEITAIKQVITCRTDRYRTPYDRTAEDHLRQCVFVGTTNEREYLDDPTGGRRFWPIVCGKINLSYIREFREQLFAEAVKLFKDGANWYEMPEEETRREQESRRHMDEWEAVICKWLIGRNEISITDLCLECLKIELGRLDLKSTRRIAFILSSQGWRRNMSISELDRNLWRRENPVTEQLTF